MNKIDADLKELKQYQEELNSDSNDGDSISSIIEAIHKNGITNEQQSEYGLTSEEYEHIKNDGGIIFVQNYIYQCNIFDYELAAGE